MTLQLAHLWALAALPLPLVVWFWLPRAKQSSTGALRVPFYAALARGQTAFARARRWPLLLAALAWLLLVLAAARPQWLGEPVPLPMAGRDLMLAIDLSGSMTERDMVYNGQAYERSEAVRAVAGDFIDRREGDRIGLILFGGRAYSQTPLTFDRQTAKTLLSEAIEANRELLDYRIDGIRGLVGGDTAIGDAIGLAVKRLRDAPADEHVLILLTDGTNTAGSIAPMKAAELAAEAGVRIYTIGVGADPRSAIGRGFGRNPLDERTLQAIAQETGGRYFRARDVAELQAIYGMLDELEPVQSDQQVFRPVDELFGWPLSAALLLSTVVVGARSGLLGRAA
jgi:Ca-activated chloride channel family protein